MTLYDVVSDKPAGPAESDIESILREADAAAADDRPFRRGRAQQTIAQRHVAARPARPTR